MKQHNMIAIAQSKNNRIIPQYFKIYKNSNMKNHQKALARIMEQAELSGKPSSLLRAKVLLNSPAV